MKAFTIRPIPMQVLIAAAIIAGGLGVTGCNRDNAPPASQPVTAGTVSPESRLIAEGDALFKQMCKSCHGSRGNGLGSSRGPSLQRKEFTYGRTREAIAQSIRGGRPGGMPSFSHVFSPRQLEAVSSYVISLEK